MVGGVSNHWTCHSNKKARRTRIDGVIADCETLATILSFEVEKRTDVPTHCVLKMEMSKNPLLEKMSFLQKLGSLKGLLEEKIRVITKEMDDKEKAKGREEEIKKMKAIMDANFIKVKGEMSKARDAKDTDKFWKLWSEAAEEAYIKFLELEPKEEKEYDGKGNSDDRGKGTAAPR